MTVARRYFRQRSWVTRRRLAVLGLTLLLAAVGIVAIIRTGLIAVPEGTTARASAFLEQYGIAALFVLFVIEGAQVLYFAPSESLVPAAVLLLSDSPPDLAVIIAVAVAGATIGQAAVFLLAKFVGREYLLEARWLRVSEARVEALEAWFEHWGPIAVAGSNAMLFVRGLAIVPAGLADMHLGRFVALSALGTLVFETVLAGLALGIAGLV